MSDVRTASVPSPPGGTPLLTFDRVSASYGPFKALFDVSLSVPAGSAVALLGTNGAGKTTVARLASGLLHPTAGRVSFAGTDISSLPTHKVAKLGVAHCVEGRSVFASLTVEENLTMMVGAGSNSGTRDDTPAKLDEAYHLFPRLGERHAQLAGTLSGGEQRMLALAAVLVSRPRLLIADELSLGLAPVIIDEVYARLAQVKANGTTLLIVEQHAEHALDLADSVVVLHNGVVSYAGPTLPVADLAPYILGLAPGPSPPGPSAAVAVAPVPVAPVPVAPVPVAPVPVAPVPVAPADPQGDLPPDARFKVKPTPVRPKPRPPTQP